MRDMLAGWAFALAILGATFGGIVIYVVLLSTIIFPILKGLTQ